MQRLIHRFRPVARALIAFVTAAFLFANLAAAAGAYPELSNCRHNPARAALSSAGDHADQAATHQHADADADSSCGCEGCTSYFIAHLLGVSLATQCESAVVPPPYFSVPLVHATHFTSRPSLPPPKFVSV